MTEQVRYRIDKALAKDFAKVCEDLGVSPSQAFSMFAAQTVKLGGLPFRPSSFPAADEYGITKEEMSRAEKVMDKEIEAAKKAGTLVEFKGKLP